MSETKKGRWIQIIGILIDAGILTLRAHGILPCEFSFPVLVFTLNHDIMETSPLNLIRYISVFSTT